mgnify:FL=1
MTIIKHENPEVLFVERLFPEFSQTETHLGVDEAREEVARLLDQSITRNLVSDVEIGGFLSSGIDSSLIASYSSRSRTLFKTFTIGFQTEGASQNEIDFDESRNAKLFAEEIGVQNHSKMINERDTFS